MRDTYLYMLLTKALAKHKQLTQEAMAGQGCDRHIMGWRVAAWGLGLEVRGAGGFGDDDDDDDDHTLLHGDAASLTLEPFCPRCPCSRTL